MIKIATLATLFFLNACAMEKSLMTGEPLKSDFTFCASDGPVDIGPELLMQSRWLQFYVKKLLEMDSCYRLLIYGPYFNILRYPKAWPYRLTVEGITRFVQYARIVQKGGPTMQDQLTVELRRLVFGVHLELLNVLDYMESFQLLDAAVTALAAKLNEIKERDLHANRSLFEELEKLPPVIKLQLKLSLICDHKNLQAFCFTQTRTTAFEAGQVSKEHQKRISGSGVWLSVHDTNNWDSHSICIYDVSRERAELIGSYTGTHTLFSPDERTLCVISGGVDRIDHTISLMDLKTREKVEIPISGFLSQEPRFSQEGSSLFLGACSFDVKALFENAGVQKPQSPRASSQENVVPRAPSASPKKMSLMRLGLGTESSSLSLSPLEKWAYKISGLRLTLFEIKDDHNQRECLSCDLMDMDSLSWDQHDALCITGAQSIFVVSSKGKIKSIKKPSVGSKAQSIQFDAKGDRLLVCYHDGTVYLYLNIDSEYSMRALCLKGAGHCYLADFTGAGGYSMITLGDENRLVQWHTSFEKMTELTFAQFFMLIKRENGSESYHAQIADSLSQDMGAARNAAQ
jgi:WD40 repeat protein